MDTGKSYPDLYLCKYLIAKVTNFNNRCGPFGSDSFIFQAQFIRSISRVFLFHVGVIVAHANLQCIRAYMWHKSDEETHDSVHQHFNL